MTYVWKTVLDTGESRTMRGTRHVLCKPDYDPLAFYTAVPQTLAVVIDLGRGEYMGLAKGTVRRFTDLEEAKAVIGALARMEGGAP